MPPLMTIRRGLIAASGGAVAADAVAFGVPQIAFTGSANNLSIDTYGSDGVLLAYWKTGAKMCLRAGNIVTNTVSWGDEITVTATEQAGGGLGNSVVTVYDDGTAPFYAIYATCADGSKDMRAHAIEVKDGSSLSRGGQTQIENGTAWLFGSMAGMNRDYHAMAWWRTDGSVSTRPVELTPGPPMTMAVLDEEEVTTNAGEMPTAWEMLRQWPTDVQDRTIGQHRNYFRVVDYHEPGNATSVHDDLELAIKDEGTGGAYLETDTFALVYTNVSQNALIGQVLGIQSGYSLSAAGSEQFVIDGATSDIGTIAASRVTANRMFAVYDRAASHYLTDISISGATMTERSTQVINASDPNSELCWEANAVRVQAAANRVIAPYRDSTSAVGVVIGTYT